MPERLFIGVMSGTSCDGVDAALVSVRGHGAAVRGEFVHRTSVAYPSDVRQTLARLRRERCAVDDFAGAGAVVAEAYADAVGRLREAAGIDPGRVTAVAAHGQTLFHRPPLTYQAFDPAVLAARVGIDVVSDFRRADCAAGGQGAPLVPFGDWVLFRDPATPRAVINLGGIANVTLLPAGGTLADVGGYDVGPANCLSDWLMRDQGGVDADGRLARTGRVLENVVADVLAGPFFARPGPKSTDTPQMIRLFEDALARRPGASLADRLATANCVAATAVSRALGPAGGVETFVAGGGVRNLDLMNRLTAGGRVVRPTDDLGVPAQAREAVAFALLAAAHVDRLPCYMPRVTGARRAAVLGSLTPGGSLSRVVTGES